MKAVLHENKLDCYVKVYENQKVIEISGESVVSDKMPDIGLLGETDAHAILRAKRTEDGVGALEGELLATVCYIPEHGAGYCNLEIGIPWQAEFESQSITHQGTSIGEVKILRMETRMLNPRKVLVKAKLQAEFSLYEKRSVSVYDGMEENPAVQIKSEETECTLTATVCEKTFVAADEYPLSADLVGGSVLCKSVRFRTDDVKSLANKLIVKGSVLSDVVVMNGQGSAERISFTSGFSFIAETDCEAVSPDVKVSIMPTALYYEIASDGKMLSVEAHGVCQMISYRKHSLRYISDAYSNFYDCTAETGFVSVFTDMKSSVHRETATATLTARSQIEQIRFATAAAIAPVYGGNAVRIPMNVSAGVKYENGTQDWLKNQITVDLKLKPNEKIVDVRVADIYSVANGTEAELRVSLDAEVREEERREIQFIAAVETDEEHPFCVVRPSVSVVRKGGHLWNLAREFGSTVELIKQYNQIEDDEAAPELPLLIPKQIQ